MSYPKTSTEAKKYRYGCWAGNPNGKKYVPDRCAYELFNEASFIPRQCSRKNGQGLNGLFCYQHAEIVLKEIKAKSYLADFKARNS